MKLISISVRALCNGDYDRYCMTTHLPRVLALI